MTTESIEERVAGKVAFISGASRGIGAGIAERYASLGVKLVLCARSKPVLAETRDVLSREVDVRDEAGVEKIVIEAEERFGAIDLWINNAGVLEPIQPIGDVSVEAFREHLDINLTGVFIGTRAFVRHRRRVAKTVASDGVLINMSSGAAWNAYQGWGAYCASKAAVERLSEVVAAEEAEAGIRVHSIAPGVVDTEMQTLIRASRIEDFPDLERFRDMKRNDAFNSVGYVADQFLSIAFDPASRPDSVAVRLENEK
jgi:NAD(P)-dependent dehydrogenase (short-subunit alcohol dehydrogenase family)